MKFFAVFFLAASAAAFAPATPAAKTSSTVRKLLFFVAYQNGGHGRFSAEHERERERDEGAQRKKIFKAYEEANARSKTLSCWISFSATSASQREQIIYSILEFFLGVATRKTSLAVLSSVPGI
jgi:hypothetical protein